MKNFIHFFTWLWSKIQEGVVWFSQSKRDIPSDESGELIRRYLAYKNWYDQISQLWVEQSFWVKATIVIGISLLSGLAEFFAVTPTLFALSVLFISLTFHSLFVAHENHRWQGAVLFAAETVALNKDLKASQLLLEKAKASVNETTVGLNNQSNELKQQAFQLDLESQLIHQQNRRLNERIDEAEMGTHALLAQENSVRKKFELMSHDLNECDQAMTQATTQITAVGDAASLFSEVVLNLQQNQKKLETAVTHFCFFQEQALQRAPDTEFSEFIASLDRENEEVQAFIESIKSSKH